MSLGVNKASFKAAEQPRPSQVPTAGGAAANKYLLKQANIGDSVSFKKVNEECENFKKC